MHHVENTSIHSSKTFFRPKDTTTFTIAPYKYQYKNNAKSVDLEKASLDIQYYKKQAPLVYKQENFLPKTRYKMEATIQNTSSVNITGPEALSQLTVNSKAPATGMDSLENVTAVFIQSGSLVTAKKPVSGTWSAPSIISSTTLLKPQLAVNSSGDSAVLWLEPGGTLKVVEKTSGGSWKLPTTLSTSAQHPQLALSSDGKIITVWVESSLLQSRIKTVAVWPSVNTVISSSGASKLKLAIGSGNDVYVVWEGPSSAVPSIRVSNTNLSNPVWAPPKLLSSISTVKPSVFVGTSGDVIISWFNYSIKNSVFRHVEATVVTKESDSSKWSKPAILSGKGIYNPNFLDIKVEQTVNGIYFVVWKNFYNGVSFVIESSMKERRKRKWFTTDFIAGDNSFLEFDLNLSSYKISLLAHTIEGENSEPVRAVLRSPDSHIPRSWYQLGIFNSAVFNGQPKISGTYFSNTGKLYTNITWPSVTANRLVIRTIFIDANLPMPPSNVQLSNSSINYKTRVENMNTITWTASTSSNVRNYVTYRNNRFIARVGPNIFTFTDKHRLEGETIIYEVATLDMDLVESTRALATSS